MTERTANHYFDYQHLGMGYLGLMLVAALGVVLTAVGAWFDPAQFAFSYLFAFSFFFTIALGALFWTMVHHAVDAEWSVVVRRQMENVAVLLVPLAVLFIPLVFVAPLLWSWMQPGMAHALHGKEAYLNPPFFWGRAVFYFLVVGALAILLRTFSVAQDATGVARYTLLNRKVAFAGLIPFALCLTFAAVDWLMGLDYRWFSTIWGVYIFAGAAVSSLCVIVLIIMALQRCGDLRVVSAEHYHILGKLILAFTVFWAYIGFSQYMLIWYANIPEETIYYLLRTTESWQVVSTFLVIGHFVIPFLFLLPEATKRNPRFLGAVAGWILLMHGLDLYIVVLPVLHPTGLHLSLLDFIAPVTVGAILALIFLKKLGDVPLYPLRDPRLPQSLTLKN